MTSLTDYGKNMLASALVGRRPALPGAAYAALGTAGSDATGIIGEPTSGGYARQLVSFTGTGTQYNAALIRFNFTNGPGTLTHIGLFDAASAGNALTWAPLATPVTLNVAGSVSIPVQSLAVLPD